MSEQNKEDNEQQEQQQVQQHKTTKLKQNKDGNKQYKQKTDGKKQTKKSKPKEQSQEEHKDEQKEQEHVEEQQQPEQPQIKQEEQIQEIQQHEQKPQEVEEQPKQQNNKITIQQYIDNIKKIQAIQEQYDQIKFQTFENQQNEIILKQMQQLSINIKKLTEFSLYFLFQIQLPQINKSELNEAQLALHIGKQNIDKQIEILSENFSQLTQDYEDLSEFQKQQIDNILLITYNLLVNKNQVSKLQEFFYNIDFCKCIKFLNAYGLNYLTASLTYLLDKDQENCLIYLKRNDTVSLLYHLIDFEQIKTYQLNFVYKYIQNEDPSVYDNLDIEYKRSLLEKILRHYAMCLIYNSDNQLICLRIIQQLINIDQYKDAVVSVRVDRALLVHISSLFLYAYGKTININEKPNIQITDVQSETFATIIQCLIRINQIYNEIPELDIKEQTLVDFIDVCSQVDLTKMLQFFILWSDKSETALILLNDLTIRKSFVSASIQRCADHDCVNILSFTLTQCTKSGLGLKLLANLLTNSDLQQYVVRSEFFREVYNLIKKYIDSELFRYDAIAVLINLISFPQTLIDYDNIVFPDFKQSQKQVVSDIDTQTLQDIFKLALRLCKENPSSQNITLLFLSSQFRVNLMPFLHYVSTLELVQNKFDYSKSTIELPHPNSDELDALVIFILSDNIKCKNHSIQALTLLSRIPDLKDQILNKRKQQILENLCLIFSQLENIQNSQIEGINLQQMLCLSLKLICYINLNYKIVKSSQCELLIEIIRQISFFSMKEEKMLEKYRSYLKCLYGTLSENMMKLIVKEEQVYKFLDTL